MSEPDTPVRRLDTALSRRSRSAPRVARRPSRGTPTSPPLARVGDEDAFTPRERSELACRLLNVSVAIVLLIATLPVTLLVALLIRLTSRGPVLYTQSRVGLDRRWQRTHSLFDRRQEDLGGEQFIIYKFRSMRVDAESNGEAQWATQNDPRVTAVGRVIRAMRIDELPQLINVLRGEMNIVGPRPERPSIFVRLREQIEQYQVRQRVKPGITGLAQVSRSYDTDIDGVREKLRLDLEYLRSQSTRTDLVLMIRTIPVMLFRIGGW